MNRSDLESFKEYELYPALYERIDMAFPDMAFRRTGHKWISPFHYDGRRGSTDQCFITEAKKHLIKDQSDRAYTLIDFEMMRTNCDFITALKRLADVCNLQVPNHDTEEYKKYLKQLKNREDAHHAFTTALWNGTPEANEVLDFLHSRYWTDEEIKDAEIGYIDEELLKSLPDRTSYSFKKGGDTIGKSHRLTITYRNGSRIFGFKFRNTNFCDEDKKNGRSKYLNSKGLAKSAGLFGIGVGYKDITVVEGELDALHAKVKGIPNVVATTGGGVGEEQARDAIKRGVKRITLLFDNDEAGNKYITSSISVLEKYRVSIFIATLPPEVKDTDEYLGTHTIEQWQDVVNTTSMPVCLWRYYKTAEKYYNLNIAQGNMITLKQREDFFSEVEAIVNAPYTLPQDRHLVFNVLKDTANELHFDADEYKAYLDRAYIRQQDRRREREVSKAVEKIQTLISDNKVDEVLKVMNETTAAQGKIDRATEFASIFAPSTPSEYHTMLSQVHEGIPTGIVFEQGSQREELTLNPGLTFVCAYRGHGKTSLLNNIALNEVTRNIKLGNDNCVLYFSYEVDKRRLIADLLNTYVNDRNISRNPLNSIMSYFRGKGYSMFTNYQQGGRRRDDGLTTIQHFELSKDKFFSNYLSSGRLTVVEENYKVGKLLDAIKYYVSSRKVSLICIDYAQLLYSEDYSRARTEEVKSVVNDLKDYANKAGIPFLLACQFNREVDSPASVDTKNIGEAGDFERIADTCIGLFNLKELKPLPKAREEEREAKKLLENLGVKMGTPTDGLKPIQGKLFLRLLKRRYGYYPIDTILDWEGSTKSVTLNAPHLLNVEPQEMNLNLFSNDELK